MSRIVVVGGGIAGLSVAGLLAVRGHKVTLIEKMFELGGRSIMQERDGFHLNFGAHAVYARDRSAMQKVADIFVLCAPPTALKRLVADTPLSPFVVPYAAEEPNTALVYDVALTKRVRNDVSYVSDMKRRVFITDPSFYDSSCVPDGGQLLQAIAYTSAKEADDEAVLTERRNDVESLYDAYYPGWREALAFSRVTDQAVVQGIGWDREQKRLPTHFQDFPNVYFAGDWCAAAGSVSDVAFASALTVASAVGMAL